VQTRSRQRSAPWCAVRATLKGERNEQGK
jgi:hypothetical protein